MLTIAQLVDNIMKERPFLEEVISEGLLNLSAMSRNIQPEIESALGRKVKEGAILMALKRYTSHLDVSINIKLKKSLAQMGEITVRSKLSDYTYKNSDRIVEKQKSLLKLIEDKQEAFYTFSQGIYETTMVISSSMSAQLEKLFASERLVSKIESLSSVTLRLPENNVMMTGLYYLILKRIAWEKINILELISTTNEFTIVVDDQDAAKTFNVLKQLSE
jgi:predicted nucleotide-binding protein (sugar kinase/HSP70/actin superfamily)